MEWLKRLIFAATFDHGLIARKVFIIASAWIHRSTNSIWYGSGKDNTELPRTNSSGETPA